MTKAFKCDGCGEYRLIKERFLTLGADMRAVEYGDFIIDELPTGVFPVQGDDHTADYCPECGREILEAIAELELGTEE